jgi:pimeloyl-ACP methyl ester carboxylesterase
VRALVLIEGLGPPDNPPEVAPDRMARWLADLESPPSERSGSMDLMVARLKANHPDVPDDVLASRAKHLLREHDGGFSWAFDPLHRTTAPVPFFSRVYESFAARVACPVLFVSGGPKGFHPPDEEHRLSAFRDVERITLMDAGHMVHWTRPNELARAILDFFHR